MSDESWKMWLDYMIEGAMILMVLSAIAVLALVITTRFYDVMIFVGILIGFFGVSYVVGRLANRMV